MKDTATVFRGLMVFFVTQPIMDKLGPNFKSTPMKFMKFIQLQKLSELFLGQKEMLIFFLPFSVVESKQICPAFLMKKRLPYGTHIGLYAGRTLSLPQLQGHDGEKEVPINDSIACLENIPYPV